MKVIKKIKNWIIERYELGTPWDFFQLGVVALLLMTIISIIISYV